MAASDVAYRPATFADTRAINEVGERELDAQRSLYRHLAETGDQFWVAERQGRIVGYARSIVRDNLRELTDFRRCWRMPRRWSLAPVTICSASSCRW